MTVHLFGIRHHGAGSSRALVQALDELRPDAVVIEAPADAEDVLALAAHEAMKPPVAILVYVPDQPKLASYYPMTVFSPEWQALTWAARHAVPVRLMDLPMSHHFADVMAKETTGDLPPSPTSPSETPSPDASGADNEQVDFKGPENDRLENEPPEIDFASTDDLIRNDPIAVLAQAAGHGDPELWWEEQVERRTEATGLFDAIAVAMMAVRDDTAHMPRDRDLLREAFMRKTLREVVATGAQRIAVVCGAYHVPALHDDALSGRKDGWKVKDDTARLKGLPKVKTAATWIPWTHHRLTFASGYGAGVHSPGWYATLWEHPDQANVWWLARTADLLRKHDLDASSASVIEAVRLADALAAMRNLRSPGLAELNEAIQAILCHGETTPMELIRGQLEVGDNLGEVPSETPAVPLVRDVEASQRSLRLKPTASIETKTLDLRNDTDRARSRLLHRLRILDVAWGEVLSEGSRRSTFGETWQLAWKPEFVVALIEANVYGNDVETAATTRIIKTTEAATELPVLTTALDAAVTAELTAAVPRVLARLDTLAAVSADVRHLLEAIGPLASVIRYGNVRGTKVEQVEPIAVTLFERAVVGLPAAVTGLDDDATERMIVAMGGVGQALGTLARADLSDDWYDVLASLAERDDVHGRLRGWTIRQRLESGRIEATELDRLARRALSASVEPKVATAWLSGLLSGSGMLLLELTRLWQVVDAWLARLDGEAFVEMLPLVRRAFADFSSPERRKMGQIVTDLPRKPLGSMDEPIVSPGGTTTVSLDAERLVSIEPVLRQLLGLPS